MSILERIEALLEVKIGLNVHSVGSSCVERSIRQRMRAQHLKAMEDYFQLLESSQIEIQELIEAVVVPETWFLRHPEAFEALKRFVREEWMARASGTPLRVLSIPCATGEEPYSIAMTLLDCGLPPDSF